MIELFKNGSFRVVKHNRLLRYTISDCIFFSSDVFFSDSDISDYYYLENITYDFSDATRIELIESNEVIIFRLMKTLGYYNILYVPYYFQDHLSDIDCVIYGNYVGFNDSNDMERIEIIKTLSFN